MARQEVNMRTETIEVIGMTLFGVTVAVSLSEFLIVALVTASVGETERLVACVEAGLAWIRGTCI